MKQHPLILAHDQTYDRQFPLILIVGREPNNKGVSNGNLGLMNFVKYVRCAFWNVAFGIFGRINGSGCREMKLEFIKRKASPLLFVDSFSQGIENAEKSKHNIRIMQIEHSEEHIDSIFKHAEVIKRVKLVLLSGLRNPIFENFKVKIKEKLVELNIPVREIPFLYPTNTNKILISLSDDDKELIKEIYKAFILETDNLPNLPNELLKRYEMDAPDTEEGIIVDLNII